MPITQTATNAFKQGMLQDMAADTFKIALYTSAASLDDSTPAYTPTGEASGGNYVAGGAVLSGAAVALSNGVAYMTFANPSWTGAITARGALIYNVSKANRAIAILDFGSNKQSSATFTVQMPAASADTALVRVK